MAKQNINSKKESQNKPQKEPVPVLIKPFSWYKFGVKLLALFFVVFAIVKYTDYKNYFRADQSNNHVERKWQSFNQFTKSKNVDVLLCGNSHIITGIDPFVFSCATSCNAFILGSPGVSIEDTYFTLGEALNKTKPKLVVIETYGINMNEDKDNGSMYQVMHYEACNQFWYKLKMMPELFNTDSWLKAWSPSIRNHSFLLTNKKQIEYNKANPKFKNESKTLDLGRFARFDIGLQDSIIAKYDSEGAPVKGSEYFVSERSKKYLSKIMQLCKDKKVPVLFLTIPMYYKHISNYADWKSALGKELAKYPESKWLDWQMPFDTSTFTPQCFENSYAGNQHLSNYGMNVTAYNLAHYLKAKNQYNLPDRSKEAEFISDFSSQPAFPYNQPLTTNTANAYQVVINQKINGFEISEMLALVQQDYSQIILKIAKNGNLNPSSVNCALQGDMNGQKMQFNVQLLKSPSVNPVGFDVYLVNIVKNMKVEKIVSIQ